MSNPFEAIWNMLKISIDTTNEPKSPLHIIEAGDCWTYLTLMVEFIRYEETGLNTTTDDEVREMLNDVIKICESQVQKLNAAKPNSNPNDIPFGVKLTDDELANGVAFKLVTCLQACSKGQADSVRNDVGTMWLQFYLEWAVFGTTLKTLMRKRGWLKVPPYYYPPGSPK